MLTGRQYDAINVEGELPMRSFQFFLAFQRTGTPPERQLLDHDHMITNPPTHRRRNVPVLRGAAD